MVINGVASEYEFPKYQAKIGLDETDYDKGFSDGKKAAFEEISNTIEAMIYYKTDEYGVDITEMYKEIVDDLQDFIMKGLENNE